MELYTTIYHSVRKEHNLKLIHCCVIDAIFNLEQGERGSCWKSKENIGKDLGLSRSAIMKVLDYLIENKKVIKSDNGRNLNVSDEVYDSILCAKARLYDIKEKNIKNKGNNSSESTQPLYRKSTISVAKVHNSCSESTHNNDSYNNSNDIDKRQNENFNEGAYDTEEEAPVIFIPKPKTYWGKPKEEKEASCK